MVVYMCMYNSVLNTHTLGVFLFCALTYLYLIQFNVSVDHLSSACRQCIKVVLWWVYRGSVSGRSLEGTVCLGMVLVYTLLIITNGLLKGAS